MALQCCRLLGNRALNKKSAGTVLIMRRVPVVESASAGFLLTAASQPLGRLATL
jgi:hypothetical protein